MKMKGSKHIKSQTEVTFNLIHIRTTKYLLIKDSKMTIHVFMQTNSTYVIYYFDFKNKVERFAEPLFE